MDADQGVRAKLFRVGYILRETFCEGQRRDATFMFVQWRDKKNSAFLYPAEKFHVLLILFFRRGRVYRKHHG